MRFLWIVLPLLASTAFAETAAPTLAQEISAHYTALPNVYELDNVKAEKISELVTR